MLNDIKSWFNQIRVTTKHNLSGYDPFKFEKNMDTTIEFQPTKLMFHGIEIKF